MHHRSLKISMFRTEITIFSFPNLLFLSPQIMAPPFSQLLKSKTWETSFIPSSSYNLHPVSLLILTDKALDPSAGISPLTFCRSAVAGLLPHIPLRELWNINLFVWLLLKSLQCFPKPCRIKSRMDDKAQHDMFLYAQGKQKTPLSALHICHALSGLGWDVTHGKPPSPPMILISLAGNSLLFPMVLWNTRSSSILFTMDVQCQIQCLE